MPNKKDDREAELFEEKSVVERLRDYDHGNVEEDYYSQFYK